LTLSVILLVVTGIGLGIYALVTVPPLVENFHRSIESQANTTRTMLIGSAGLVSAVDNPREAARFVTEISRAPQIRGVVIANAANRVIAGAWQGEVLTEADAVDKIVHEQMRRWPIEGRQGQGGVLFVALDAAWPTDLEKQIVDAGMVIVAAVLVLALLVSISIRELLARQITALRRATTRIANGDYDVRVSVRGRGPIAELISNFNKMAADLGTFTHRLRTSEERFELAVSGSNEGIWDWDVRNNQLYLSPRYGKILGYEEKELPGMFTAWQRLIHPDDRRSVLEALHKHMQNGDSFRCELRLQSKGGSWIWMLGRGTVVRDASGTATRMVGSFADVSEQKATELALAREKERLQVTLKSIADAVITTDIAGRVTYMNPAAERLTDWASDDALRHPIETVLDFLNDAGASSITDALRASLDEGGIATDLGQAELLSHSGEKHIVEHSIAPLRDRNDQVIGGVIVVHDITDRYKLMQQLSYQAVHDPLTQLINRTGFEMRLAKSLDSAAAQPELTHAICYIDLDQFKIVNDTCGHSAGDELLRQVAVQLKKHVRKGDTLARLGGDEFGLLLECCPLEKALDIAEKIRSSIESFRFSWEGKSFSVGLSIGLAPIDGSPGLSVASVLSSVDQACYIAKSKGRNRIHTYQPGDNESSRWHTEMQWVPHIHQAMDEGNFVLLAQPVVAVDEPDGQHRHYEILLRMRGANGDLISPGSFLPAAERYNLMAMLDRWVVSHAIDLLALAWGSNSDLSSTTFGLNISGAVLSDNSLLTYVKDALAAYKLPPSLLCFEITETVAIANFTHAQRFVNELKEIGCRFALDDFGSGFASFSYLKTLPVDYLKIDGSFVRHLTDNPVDHTMVDIINQLGHVMGLKTIAEFVENERILDALRKLGVDYAQGYHIGRPIPLHDIFYGEGAEEALQLHAL